MSNPLYSYSSDASPEFQSYLADLMGKFVQHIDNDLALSSLGGDASHPFSAVRDGDVVHLMYPQNVKQGDLLAAVITALASTIPTCVLHESTAGWSEPEWSTESRRHLGGLLTGLQAVPESFSHTSAPADLARISLWITTCAAALSRPGGVADAQGDVLPSTVGGLKSASKYMTKVISGLRSSVTDDSCLKAIDTLSMLLKIWQKENYDKSLTIVRKCKIGWASVLFRAAPTETIKGKRGRPDQTVLRPPVKPSRSPWLSPAERSELGKLFKDDWSFLEDFRKSFIALAPEQQHRQFGSYIRRIKEKYEHLNSLSNSIHSRIGKRKYWIEKVCKADNFKPKAKKNESESFLLSQHFFKKDLTKLDQRVKKVFSPLTYLDEIPYRSTTIYGNCFSSDDQPCRITASDFTENDDGEAFRLWQIWAEYTRPVFPSSTVTIEDPPQLDNFNPFSVLPERGA